MSDTKEKLEDDFIEFWDTHAEKLGLGKYYSEIARFWLDKLDVAIAEDRKRVVEMIDGIDFGLVTRGKAEVIDTVKHKLKKKIINIIN